MVNRIGWPIGVRSLFGLGAHKRELSGEQLIVACEEILQRPVLAAIRATEGNWASERVSGFGGGLPALAIVLVVSLCRKVAGKPPLKQTQKRVVNHRVLAATATELHEFTVAGQRNQPDRLIRSIALADVRVSRVNRVYSTAVCGPIRYWVTNEHANIVASARGESPDTPAVGER